MSESIWKTIVLADLDAHMIAIRLDAIRTGGLRAGQVDPFTPVMQDITTRVRAVISKQGKTISGDAYTVPPEAKLATCWLILEAMQVRIPGLMLTDDQKRQVDQAEDYLRTLGDPNVSITTPSNPVLPAVTSGGGVVVLSSTASYRVTAAKLDGLM